MEAAGAHTEGSMNVHVETAEGRATICGDVIYDFHDQIIEPFRSFGPEEYQVTGNHGGSKRAEKGRSRKLMNSGAKFLLPVHDKPAKIERGQVIGRMDMAVPGPVSQTVPGATGSRPEEATMAHEALDPAFRRLIDEHAPVRQLGTGFTFTEGPIWHPVEHYLLFSDMPADIRRRLGPRRRARGHEALEQGQRHDL